MKNTCKARFGAAALFLLLLALMPLLPCAAEEPAVVISEIMAANDVWKNGHHDDWVELYNPSGKTADLSGWHLSDSAKKTGKFTFPEGTKLKKGETLLVWCTDREERAGSGSVFYAPFKLSQEGEQVILTRPDGTIADRVVFALQYAGISYGLDRNGNLGYLDAPSPGKKNSATAYQTRTGAPAFASPGGFYGAPVTARADAPDGAVIRYTLDGEIPTAKSPALPGAGVEIKKTTAVRIRAFREGELPSETVTANYLINDPSPCPVVCLTGEDRVLFNAKTGALVKGNGSTPNYEKELEYPIHIAYYDASGRCLIDQMGSFTAAGHSARQNSQRSIALYARGIFGQDEFAFNPFPHRDYAGYKSLLLRNNSDAFSTRLRDPVISSLAEGQDILYQDALAVQVYINGRYWGHYNLREKINKYFIAQYEGITDADEIDAIDILARTGSDAYVQNGSNADWVALCEFCKTRDLNDPDSLAYVLERLDVDSLFTHAAFEMIIGNNDITNVRVYRVPGGKWRYLLFDVEAGFLSLKEGPISNYIKPVSAKIQAFRHEPLNALLNVPAYRDAFLKRFAALLEESFAWPYVEAHFAPWEAAVSELLDRQYERWPYLTRSDWQANVNAVKYYAKKRPVKVIDLLAERMKLTAEEKERYFGAVRTLLEEAARTE